MRPQDRQGVYAWEPFYAAFSERFAITALPILSNKSRDRVVLDPFVGGGTSLVAAAKLGFPAVGIDLDPVSALLSRARIAITAKRDQVQNLLKDVSGSFDCQFSERARKLFRPSDLSFAAAIFARIQKQTGLDGSTLLDSLLDDLPGQFDSEVVALTASCLAARKTAKTVRGSNPVWYRPSLPGEIDPSPKLATQARILAK